MLFEGEFRVEAPVHEVWNFLLDLEKVAGCVPGLEKAGMDEDGGFWLVVKAKVGFLTATVHLQVRILESDPPRMLKSEFKGVDKKLGSSLKQINSLELAELGPSTTEVRYASDVSFLGKLGTLGRPIIKAKASQVMKEFTTALKERVEGTGAGALAQGVSHEAV